MKTTLLQKLTAFVLVCAFTFLPFGNSANAQLNRRKNITPQRHSQIAPKVNPWHIKTPTNSTTFLPPNHSGDPDNNTQVVQPALVVECIVAGVIIVGGIYIGYRLKKLCDAKLGPYKAPNTNTNSLPPGATNPPTANRAASAAIAAMSSSPQFVAQYELPDDILNEQVTDISSAGWTAPDGSLFYTMVMIQCETSPTVFGPWQLQVIFVYLSDTQVLTEIWPDGSPTNAIIYMQSRASFNQGYVIDLGLPKNAPSYFFQPAPNP